MRNGLYRPGLSGLGSTLIAGFSEYAMTGGVSGWIPLVAGLLGAATVIMWDWIFGKKRSFSNSMTSDSNSMTSEQRFELAKIAQEKRHEFWSDGTGCFIISGLGFLIFVSLLILGVWLEG